MSQVYILLTAYVCVTALAGYLVPGRLRYVWLLLCSWAFYLWALLGLPAQTPEVLRTGGLRALIEYLLPAVLFLGAATFLGWLCCLGMQIIKAAPLRAAVFVLALGCSLGPWVAHKYFGFLPTHLGFVTLQQPAALPLGLGFYSLQAAGCALDVFMGRAKAEKNPLRHALFTGFYPGVIAGPINRAGAMLPQYKHPPTFSYNRFFGGLFRMLWGVFKKMVVADNLALFTGYVMATPTQHTGPVLLACLVVFAFQLYCDLSAYADLAVGAAGMLGFTFAENFASPITAKSFAQLPGRWMASVLAVWQDLLALPLGTLWPRVKPLAMRLAAALPAPLQSQVAKPALRAHLKRILWAGCTAAAFALFGLWLGTGYLLWGLAVGLVVALSGLLAPLWERLAVKVPVYRAVPLRSTLRSLWVFLLFCGCLLLFVPTFYGQPLGDWAWRLTAGWESLSVPFLLERFWRSGLTWPRLLAAAGGLVGVLALEGFAAKPGATLNTWIRKRRFFVRWPLYFALVVLILLFGVFPATGGILLGV